LTLTAFPACTATVTVTDPRTRLVVHVCMSGRTANRNVLFPRVRLVHCLSGSGRSSQFVYFASFCLALAPGLRTLAPDGTQRRRQPRN
ncbi:hypothetical protein O181_065437, partial [Austropuccinia psidii MF-1]|nr:hypothetical protein [Austropuccinia psidii MF-1]